MVPSSALRTSGSRLKTSGRISEEQCNETPPCAIPCVQVSFRGLRLNLRSRSFCQPQSSTVADSEN